MSRNPFQYGRIVGGESFCNREQEQADLLRAMENGDRLFVYSESVIECQAPLLSR